MSPPLDFSGFLSPYDDLYKKQSLLQESLQGQKNGLISQREQLPTEYAPSIGGSLISSLAPLVGAFAGGAIGGNVSAPGVMDVGSKYSLAGGQAYFNNLEAHRKQKEDLLSDQMKTLDTQIMYGQRDLAGIESDKLKAQASLGIDYASGKFPGTDPYNIDAASKLNQALALNSARQQSKVNKSIPVDIARAISSGDQDLAYKLAESQGISIDPSWIRELRASDTAQGNEEFKNKELAAKISHWETMAGTKDAQQAASPELVAALTSDPNLKANLGTNPTNADVKRFLDAAKVKNAAANAVSRQSSVLTQKGNLDLSLQKFNAEMAANQDPDFPNRPGVTKIAQPIHVDFERTKVATTALISSLDQIQQSFKANGTPMTGSISAIQGALDALGVANARQLLGTGANLTKNEEGQITSLISPVAQGSFGLATAIQKQMLAASDSDEFLNSLKSVLKKNLGVRAWAIGKYDPQGISDYYPNEWKKKFSDSFSTVAKTPRPSFEEFKKMLEDGSL